MTKQYKTGPIMAALLVAGFVGLFSETALNVALGQLGEIFNVGPTTVQWLATGYFLTLGILIPVTGILMQKFTTRQMFLTSDHTKSCRYHFSSISTRIWCASYRTCDSSSGISD